MCFLTGCAQMSTTDCIKEYDPIHHMQSFIYVPLLIVDPMMTENLSTFITCEALNTFTCWLWPFAYRQLYYWL